MGNPMCRYYTGLPWEFKTSRIIDFKSERLVVELLREGAPVVVAVPIRCPWTRRFDRVMDYTAAEWYPHLEFVRVECLKYPGFCIARQRKDDPFDEMFHSFKAEELVPCPVLKREEAEGLGSREGSMRREISNARQKKHRTFYLGITLPNLLVFILTVPSSNLAIQNSRPLLKSAMRRS